LRSLPVLGRLRIAHGPAAKFQQYRLISGRAHRLENRKKSNPATLFGLTLLRILLAAAVLFILDFMQQVQHILDCSAQIALNFPMDFYWWPGRAK